MKLTKLEGYSDARGNQLIVEEGAEFRASSLTFSGTGAVARIGAGAVFSRAELTLGGSAQLFVGGGSRVSGSLAVGLQSRIHIGENFRGTGNIAFRAVEKTSIEIGDDCLFARDISIRTNDGHPIYDARTRERINPSQSIVIGRHVWLGDEVMVLKGASVGNATIVGARSVVTRDLPANAICVGTPARVIREGVTWEHAPGVTTEEFYL